MTVTDGSTTLTGAEVMSFDVSGATLFAGIGGALNGTNDGLALPPSAIGFSASSASLAFVMATGAVGDGAHAGDQYVGAEVDLGDAQLVGVSGFELWSQGIVGYNSATDADGSTPVSSACSSRPSTR